MACKATASTPTECGIALRQALEARAQGYDQKGGLGAQYLLDAGAERGPMLGGHGEIPSEIESRHLTNTLSVAFTTHQAIGEVGLPVQFTARGGATNEHRRTLHTRLARDNRVMQILWHYKRPARTGLRKNQRFSFGESAENG